MTRMNKQEFILNASNVVTLYVDDCSVNFKVGVNSFSISLHTDGCG